MIIDGAQIETCSNIKRAVFTGVRESAVLMLLQDLPGISGCHVRLRYMLLCRSPSECKERSSESVHLNYPQLPNTFARMIVMMPSAYTACAGKGTLTASWGDASRDFTLDAKCNGQFSYVFGYAHSTMHIHAPAQGSLACLVYDVASAEPVALPAPSTRIFEAQAMIRKSISVWESDVRRLKLAVPLGQPWKTLNQGGGICVGKVKNLIDSAVVAMLRNCEELDVGFAGNGSFWMCVCVYACMYIHAYFDVERL